MSAGDINSLLELWAADVCPKGGRPPFSDNKDLCSVIDSINKGDAPWHSFKVAYDGTRPENNAPEWMSEHYEIWHRDPLQVAHQLLANPDFDNHFDYTPY